MADAPGNNENPPRRPPDTNPLKTSMLPPMHDSPAPPKRSEMLTGPLDLTSDLKGNESNEELLKLLHEQAGITQNVQKKLQGSENENENSEIDEKTGLIKEGPFMNQLAAEIDRSIRNKHKFSLIMFDLDKFKDANDQFGHAIGDRILRSVADMIDIHARPSDIKSHLHGDEFAILLPEQDDEEISGTGAKIRAERLLKAIRESHFPTNDNHKTAQVGATFGIATFNGADEKYAYPRVTNKEQEGKDILTRADDALYLGKLIRGRNNVVNYSEVTPEQWQEFRTKRQEKELLQAR